jgi:hypothetical protein
MRFFFFDKIIKIAIDDIHGREKNTDNPFVIQQGLDRSCLFPMCIARSIMLKAAFTDLLFG